MIAILLLVAGAVAGCPETLTDELALIAQPIECFRQLYDNKQFDNQKLLRVVSDRLQAYQRMLHELKMSDQQHLQTTPVLKWAQSQSQIFISFKLSHRQDSPTCSDIREEFFRTEQIDVAEGEIEFEIITNDSLNGSVFSYKGECFFTTQKFWFSLHLQFQHFLGRLVLKKQGLGLYTLTGDKKEPEIWGEPFNGYRKAAIWSEMRHKHSADMDRYFEMVQATAQSQQPTKRRKRRPKKGSESQL